jgi:large subunit ribosomal protein L23
MIHRFVQRDKRPATAERLLQIVRGVILTEKSTLLTQARQYTFQVALDANKFEVRQAIEHLFDVKVAAVNTVKLPGKEKRFRGRRGQRSPLKKAIVTLAEGQNIDLTAGVSL